jgi:hypothetical protein
LFKNSGLQYIDQQIEWIWKENQDMIYCKIDSDCERYYNLNQLFSNIFELVSKHLPPNSNY